MPKKSKSQKIKASQRDVTNNQLDQNVIKTIPGLGHFWTRTNGLRLLLISELDQNNEVDTALCCIDEWRDGIFKCHFGHFENLDLVVAEISSSPFKWVRGDLNQSRKIVGMGARILKFLEKEFPPDFERFQRFLGTDYNTSLPPGTYSCVICDDALVPEYVNFIKESAHTGREVYIVCKHCQNKRLGAKRSNYAVPKHLRFKNAFFDSEVFSLSPHGYNHLERALNSDSTSEAIGLMLVQDTLKGIAYSLEKHIIDGTITNPQLTDGQVIEALEILKKAIEEDQELKPTEDFEVNFILELLDEAVALIKQLFREEVNSEPHKKELLTAVDTILSSARARAGRETSGRSYIEFVVNYI